MTYKPSRSFECINCGHKKVIARKLCRRCYYNARNRGELLKYRLLGPEDVFIDRIKKTETCWLWSGTKNEYGYGIFLMPGEKPVRAHRYSYEFFKGKIPDGMVVMHVCDNPPCVNPDHLRIGTKLENNRDASTKGRRPKGDSHWNAKLSADQVKEILESTEVQWKTAKKYGVTQSHISRLKTGKIRC